MDLNRLRKLSGIPEVLSLTDGAEELYTLLENNGKLSGDLSEDNKYINTLFQNLMEDDDFDPFAHLIKTDKIDPKDDCVLTISKPNTKLKNINAPSFSLPAGYACPMADVCKSMAHRKGKAFKDGKKIKDQGDIRCYAASSEVQYKKVRNNRWRNYDLLRDVGGKDEMAKLISRSLKYYENNNGKITTFRIHDSGDFFSQEYFDAWLTVAKNRTDIHFYAYTKSLSYWKNRKDKIPSNLKLIASQGGKEDELIDTENFRKSVIVKDVDDAKQQRLHIDVDDSLAAFGDTDFALLVHGSQKAGSEYGKHARDNRKYKHGNPSDKK